MKICFVHDYLNQFGGAEKTLGVMHEIWPESPVYTTLVDWGVVGTTGIPPKLVRYPRWLHWPVVGSLYKYFTFFYPLIFESFDFSKYQVVISSSANFAKAVVTLPGQVHINYCHTPPRFLYRLPTETNKRSRWFWRPILALLDFKLRMWDYTAAQRVDHFVANSQVVARRIRKFYRRGATVIYPPVEVANYPLLSDKARDLEEGEEEYYLIVSRLSAYKNIDLAICACAEINRDLKIVGIGPEQGRLKKLAGQLQAPVEFLGFVSNEKLASLYLECKALISTVLEEDFGIVQVEAMSFGKPVIALRSGGVRETIKEGETGIFYDRPSIDSLIKTIKEYEAESYFQGSECAKKCRQQAEGFGKERFKKEFKEFVEGCVS